MRRPRKPSPRAGAPRKFVQIAVASSPPKPNGDFEVIFAGVDDRGRGWWSFGGKKWHELARHPAADGKKIITASATETPADRHTPQK
jgi:hypothetical protein